MTDFSSFLDPSRYMNTAANQAGRIGSGTSSFIADFADQLRQNQPKPVTPLNTDNNFLETLGPFTEKELVKAGSSSGLLKSNIPYSPIGADGKFVGISRLGTISGESSDSGFFRETPECNKGKLINREGRLVGRNNFGEKTFCITEINQNLLCPKVNKIDKDGNNCGIYKASWANTNNELDSHINCTYKCDPPPSLSSDTVEAFTNQGNRCQGVSFNNCQGYLLIILLLIILLINKFS